MKITRMYQFVTGIGLAALLAGTAHATITVKGLWQIGENDPGAASGVLLDPLANNTGTLTDSVGGLTLTASGTNPFFTNNTYTNNTAPGSTLAAHFNVVPYFTAAGAVSTATDNIGYEIWFNPDSGQTGQGRIFGANGYEIYTDGGKFAVHISGAYLGPVTGSPNVSDYYGQWVDLALVRDNGTSMLYINGVGYGFNNNIYAGPTPTSVSISQANSPSTWTLDNARIFTFDAGQFSTSDLLINSVAVPEPSAALLVGLGGLILFRRIRRKQAGVS